MHKGLLLTHYGRDELSHLLLRIAEILSQADEVLRYFDPQLPVPLGAFSDPSKRASWSRERT